MTLNTKDLFGDTEFVASSEPQYHDAPFYLPLLNCKSCSCRPEAQRVIPGMGPKAASILFIGRNPGRDEDKRGLPFVGRGGGELDRMMEALGLDRLKVGITNAVKCHTTGDRAPKPPEIDTCTTLWLTKELEFFDQASIIFPLGREAVTVMLGPNAESPGKREGYWVRVEFAHMRVLYVCPLNHPGYILRARGMQMQMYNNTLPSVKQYMMENLQEAYGRSRAA